MQESPSSHRPSSRRSTTFPDVRKFRRSSNSIAISNTRSSGGSLSARYFQNNGTDFIRCASINFDDIPSSKSQTTTDVLKISINNDDFEDDIPIPPGQSHEVLTSDEEELYDSEEPDEEITENSSPNRLFTLSTVFKDIFNNDSKPSTPLSP
eukprot:CAMPEP_0117431058 /NCGR_PEP_ID=MMETSP0758-20121206/10608_1 /TAXON_ID=63605 /ORGANISM="Percolomonas cosmopolitus, Strain AE-1 (ATCC 50343)" /LENGTH=151 /DNA_ID=CAMNT_0005219719 /DNA_START=1703 /DNA_END=2154 /DNA_ORIENTATION=-